MAELPPKGRVVYECANPACRLIWDCDPLGHCPGCKTANGGWSTIAKAVLPLPENLISDALTKPFAHPVEDDE